MIFIVVYPYFVPLAAVQLTMRIDDQLTGGAGAQSEIEGQLMAARQRHHERWIVCSDRWLEQQNGLLAGGAKREGDVTFAPARHLDVRLRCREGHHEFLCICNAM